MLYDHLDVRVSDLDRVRSLYDALLPALGCPHVETEPGNVCWYPAGRQQAAPFFSIVRDAAHRPNGSRFAFRANDRGHVDRVAALALEAGARNFEPPAIVPEYTPSYYATFFEDADGNKLEVCFRD